VSEKREYAFEKFTIPVKGSLKAKNLVHAKPAGVGNLSWVEP
jgi:hypothetical protein